MLYKIAKVEKTYLLVVQFFFLAPCIHVLQYGWSWSKLKLPKMQKKKTIWFFNFTYILKLLVLAKRFPVISSKINTMEHYMGLQSKKKNYFFICDDIIELQMFQGYQNWSWISQGVLGSSFSRTWCNPGSKRTQLYYIWSFT